VAAIPIHIVIPVWGQAYTRGLIELGLPALLAPGNVPNLCRGDGHLCQIITTAADRATIERSAVFRSLAAAINVRFDDISANPEASDDRHKWQSYCNRLGIKTADERGAATMFLNPDVVIADGGVRSLAALLQKGKRAIQVLGVRLIKEITTPALIEGYTSPDGTRLVISPRELIRLAMKNLHPLTLMHMYDRADLGLSPSGLFWAAADQGLVCRCFHLHPMLVFPRIPNAPFSTTIDDDYLRSACPDPADGYIVDDSDEFCAIELSGMERARPGLPRGDVNESVAKWATHVAKLEHFENLARRIFLRAADDDPRAWRNACLRSDDAVHGILNRVLKLQQK
jgi:hypothetical protein